VQDRREALARGRSGNSASPARLVADTFVRAIETSDFERRLRLVEADHFNNPGDAVGMNGAGPGFFGRANSSSFPARCWRTRSIIAQRV